MRHYDVYKKRDGQEFILIGDIYADSFEDAKKQFAKDMTNGFYIDAGAIVSLSVEEDGVEVDGFYDFNGGTPEVDENGKYNPIEARDFLMVSKASIDAGFDYWNEDVFTWELRDKEA